MNAALLAYVRLVAHHEPTGHTGHIVGGAVLPMPLELRVVSYAEDPGVYLLYISDPGSGLADTDTYHMTMQDAFEQARLEFSVLPSEWRRVRGP